MNNLFDTSNYPDAVPDELVAGNRWAWTRSDITAAYPTAEYTLKFRFSLLVSPYSDYSVTATKSSSAHVVEVATSTTGGFVVGEYGWQAIAVRDSDDEEVTIDRGIVSVIADLGDTPGNTASWVYRTLQAIRANLEGTATRDDASYSVAGRSLARRTIDELLTLEREFARRWEAEKAEINRKAGRKKGGRVLAKMSA